MVNFICQECNKTFEVEKSLHFHLKAHNLGVDQYYQKWVPRYDLWNGEIIKFKNKDQYLNTDFNSRMNMINYLTKKASPEEARTYSIELLKDRKEEKNLKYALSFVETKSLMVPSVEYYERYQGGYNKICESIGLKPRFDYTQKFTAKTVKPKDFHVLIDPREQDPLKFTVQTVRTTLNVGDYAPCANYFNNIIIERKELGDFAGTLSKGFDRFKKEIVRAQELGVYLVIMVERPLKDALGIEFLPYLHTQATASFLFHRLRDLMQEFLNIQFLFVNGRKEMVRIVENIFLSNSDIRNIDLQHNYIKGDL